METESSATESESFSMEITKSFVRNTAASAGVWAGVLLSGLAVSKYRDRKENRPTNMNPVKR